MSSAKSQFTEEQWAKLRYRCQTDLYFLGKDVLKKDFVEGTHKAMCDFYVKKDPSYGTFKRFAQSYAGSHDRMQLVPRECYKSSIKVVDNAQWIINWSEIRIMSCTSAKDLSAAFIDELISYFTIRGGHPTLFQELFPEHCISEDESRVGEFKTPARANVPPELLFKEPTAGTLSMDGSSSGWHCDVTDFDDPVSDRNSESGNQLEKLRDRISMIGELVMNYGFTHYVATRYNPDDPYGRILSDHGIMDIYGDHEKDGLKYMGRPCLWLKDKPYQQPDYTASFPKEEDIDLFFPEGSPYLSLRKKFKNRKIFFSQQLNDPQRSTNISFTEELVRSCLIDHSALPKSGSIFAAWDFAFSSNKNSDDSAGVIGLIDDRREWWIIDIVMGHFNFSERCHQVVKTIGIHHPRRSCIENAAGAEDNYREPLDRTAKLANVPLDIDWISLGRGTADAKYIRMCSLHPWMSERRIHFLNTLPCVDELVRQFKNVGQKAAMNEIPDAMSRLVEQYTRYSMSTSIPVSSDDERRWRELEEKDFHDMIFQRGKFEPLPPPVKVQEEPSPSWAIDELFQ